MVRRYIGEYEDKIKSTKLKLVLLNKNIVEKYNSTYIIKLHSGYLIKYEDSVLSQIREYTPIGYGFLLIISDENKKYLLNTNTGYICELHTNADILEFIMDTPGLFESYANHRVIAVRHFPNNYRVTGSKYNFSIGIYGYITECEYAEYRLVPPIDIPANVVLILKTLNSYIRCKVIYTKGNKIFARDLDANELVCINNKNLKIKNGRSGIFEQILN